MSNAPVAIINRQMDIALASGSVDDGNKQNTEEEKEGDEDEEPQETTKHEAALTMLQRAARREKLIKKDLSNTWESALQKYPVLVTLTKVFDLGGLFSWLQGISSRIAEAAIVYLMMIWSAVMWIWDHRTAIHFWFQALQCAYHYKAILALSMYGKAMYLLQRLVAAPSILILLEWIIVIVINLPLWLWHSVTWTYRLFRSIPITGWALWAVERALSPFVNAAVWLISWFKPQSRVGRRGGPRAN